MIHPERLKAFWAQRGRFLRDRNLNLTKANKKRKRKQKTIYWLTRKE